MAETVVTDGSAGPDAELATLDGLTAAVRQNVKEERLLVRRLDRLRAGRAEGRSWRELLGGERRPGTLDLSVGILRRITEASGTLRRSLVQGLRAEGATIPAIAAAFGVSHQRVSALLRHSDRRPPP
jgi:hypothetical protein